MGLKTDKVLKNIEEAYRVLASKAEGNPKVQSILEALNQTAKHLKDEKLVMHLITTQPELKPAFLACAGAWKNFPDHFRIAECSIPQEVEPVIPAVPSVSLLVSTNGNGAKSRVTLNGMSLLIGRNPERCSLLIPDSFGRVHGLHAELAPMTRPMVPNQPMVWAIINKGQNGTFVNGQPVYESKHLESGDRVTLGGPVADRLVAELVFEVLNPGDQSPSATQTLLNCDILCVVTTPDEMLAPAHQELLKMLSSTSPSKVLFVVDIPPKDEAILQTVKEKTAILETWIQPGSGSISVETVPFPVTCFSAAVPTGGLLPKEGKALVEIFEALAKKKEDWLIRRLSPLITWHLAKAEPLFQPVDPGPSQTSEDLETLALSQRRILRQVKEKAMALVQLGEEQLAQSKGKILDGLRQSSLIYKIQVFAQGLETVIVTRHGQKFMKLQVASNPDQNVGHALQHLCITELRNWSTLEWERIAQGKDDKPGLMQGIEQMISTLHELSSLKQGYGAPTVKLLSRLPRHPQFDGILGISIALPSSEIHFKEDSFFKSIFKDLRSGLMSIGFLATLSVLITGIVSSESDGKSQGGIKYIAAKLAGLPLEIKLGAGLVVLFLFGLLVRDFYGSRTVRRDEIKEKLSKDLVAHFNLVAKNLVEHLVQELEKCLEAEERHLKVTLDTLDEELAQSLGELKKTADRQKQKMAEARKEQELFQKILAALAGPG